MAKDTRIVIVIPGEYQLLLTEYMLLLREKGVRISKAEAIAQLAMSNVRRVVEELRFIDQDDYETGT